MAEIELRTNDEGIPIFSHSQLNTWLQCHYKWNLSYVGKWTKRDKGQAISKGSFFHDLLKGYYKAQIAGESYDLNADLQRMLVANDLEYTYQVVSWGGDLMRRYIEEFAPVADELLRPVAAEGHFESKFETPKGNTFVLEYYIDLLMQDIRQNNLWIMETKSHDSSSKWTSVEMMMDFQTPSYIAGLYQHGHQPHGAIFNFVNRYEYKKGPPPLEKVFDRERIIRTPTEIGAIMTELGKAVDDLLENVYDTTRNLSRNCKMCWFQEPCLMGLKGVPVEDYMESNPGFEKKVKRATDADTNKGLDRIL